MGEKGIFDELLESKTLFKNREVLRPTYTPGELPHRSAQINYLASIMVPALKGETPSNIFIYGKTGTGKTAVAKLVGKELENKALEISKINQQQLSGLALESLENGNIDYLKPAYEYLGFKEFFSESLGKLLKTNVNFIYINCQHVDTQYRVLTHIANSLIKIWPERLPLTGLPTDEVYNRLRESIESSGGVTTIILDEIDKLVEKSGDDILYNLTRINSDLQDAKVNLIGITNTLKFTEFLDPRVKSSLGEEEFSFPPYDAEQLKDILNQRAELAFNPGLLDDGVVPLCAALAAQEHGDARRALDLLRTSAELAERDGLMNVEERFVRKALSKIEQDIVAEVIQTLPPQSKLVLLGIIINEDAKNDKITTGMAFDTYLQLCNKVNIDSLTQRRVTDLISELDMLGIINARVVSFGRGGRTRLIQMSVPIDKTKKILEESELLVPVINFKPKLQSTLM